MKRVAGNIASTCAREREHPFAGTRKDRPGCRSVRRIVSRVYGDIAAFVDSSCTERLQSLHVKAMINHKHFAQDAEGYCEWGPGRNRKQPACLGEAVQKVALLRIEHAQAAPSDTIVCTRWMYNKGINSTPALSPAFVLLCIAVIVVAGLVLEYFSHRDTYRPQRKLQPCSHRQTDSSGRAD